MIPERAELSNGLTVLYTYAQDIPLAAGTLLVRASSYDDAVDKAGLCQMGTQMLLQGTRRRNAKAFATALESMGSAIGAHATDDYSELGFIAPEGEILTMLSLAGEMFDSASFPKDELDKEKAHTLAALHVRQDAIFNVAHDAMMKGLYGDHPYGRLTEGTVESVQSITRQNLQRWNASQWTPSKAVFSIVAGLPWTQLRRSLEAAFKRWKNNSTALTNPKPKPKPLPTLRAAKHIDLSAPFEQSYLMSGLLAPSAEDSSALALKVLNTLVGGGMSSRLFVQLREERGLAYDVSSFFPTRIRPSHWVFYLGCSPENLKIAERTLEEVLEKLATQGVTKEEVLQAKAMIRGQFVMDHQTRRRRAWYFAWWEFLGRGAKYDHQFLRRLDGISVADVNRLAKDLLSRPRLTVRVSPA